MKTIAFWNRKGGVGKTTTAGNVAFELSHHGRVLLIDCDPQANMTSWLAPGAQHELADVLSGSVSLADAVTPARATLDVLGSFAIGGELRDWIETNIRKQPFAFVDLKSKAEALGYTFVVMDLAPGDGPIELYAMSACDHVVLVASPETFSYEGLESAEHTLQEVRTNLRAQFTIPALVANRINRSYAAHQAYSEAIEKVPYEVFQIGQATGIHDCLGQHKTIFEHEPGNRYTTEYVRLAGVLL